MLLTVSIARQGKPEANRSAILHQWLPITHSRSFLFRQSHANSTPEALSSFLRIVALSATLPNVSSIASFVEAHEAYAFDVSYRPVPLTTHVVDLGFRGQERDHVREGPGSAPAGTHQRFSRAKPTIFWHTKKEIETLVMELSKVNGIGIPNGSNIVQVASQTKLSTLQRSLL